MSTHPNVILMVVITPEGLSRKTMKKILADNGIDDPEGEITIGTEQYRFIVMEETYDKSNQIEAKEGDLIFFDLVTYGYGESITWSNLQERKEALERWAFETSGKHHCSFEIRVSANYW